MTLDSSRWSPGKHVVVRRTVTVLSFCCAELVMGSALGQPLDVTTRTTARELATQGADAFERGDYLAALDYLSRANTLHPAPSISVLEARALVHLGRFIEALDRYAETLRIALPEDAPEAFRVAARDASVESDQLRQRMPHLSVQVRQGGATPKNISVTIDGKALPSVLLDVDFPTDPGDHRIVVRAPRHDPVTRRVRLAEKERVVLEITLDDSIPSVTGVVPTSTSSTTAATSARPMWGWSAVGGGAAALLASAITGKVALDKKSQLDSVCHPGCPAVSAGDIDAFRTYRTVSYIAGGAGVALVGVGGYLLLSGSSRDPSLAVGFVGTHASLWGSF